MNYTKPELVAVGASVVIKGGQKTNDVQTDAVLHTIGAYEADE